MRIMLGISFLYDEMYGCLKSFVIQTGTRGAGDVYVSPHQAVFSAAVGDFRKRRMRV